MTAANAYQIEVSKLRRRVEELEAAVDYWRDKAKPACDLLCPLDWHISASEETILGVLLRAPAAAFATRRSINAALYGDRCTSDRVLDVLLCKLRRKIAPRGVVIENVWGRGFRLSDTGRAVLNDVVGVMRGTTRARVQRVALHA
jgi:two-component system cell cycle response regulator CtrA